MPDGGSLFALCLERETTKINALRERDDYSTAPQSAECVEDAVEFVVAADALQTERQALIVSLLMESCEPNCASWLAPLKLLGGVDLEGGES